LAALLLLNACAGEEPPPPPPGRPQQVPGPVASPPPPAAVITEVAPLAGSGPADLLRRYYGLIEARRFAEAHELRETGGADLPAFTAHFQRFASHRATVGIPSREVPSGEWIYAEVPVHSYGIMSDGQPFGSAGTVTLRRPSDGGGWRIYTKR
jgi:hypothetical protein